MSSSSAVRRLAVVFGLAAALSLGFAGPAAADPKGEVIPLECDNGSTYLVAVNGNGDFTPGHDTQSTRVLIPVAFGEFHGVLTAENGDIVDEFTDPPAAKGPARNADISCTFTIIETFQDPELGPGTFTFTGTGSVQGFVTPRHK